MGSQKATIALLLVLGLALILLNGCFSGVQDYREARRYGSILDQLQPHAHAALDAFEAGDESRARDEFETSLSLLDNSEMSSLDEKISFLNKYFTHSAEKTNFNVLAEALLGEREQTRRVTSRARSEEVPLAEASAAEVLATYQRAEAVSLPELVQSKSTATSLPDSEVSIDESTAFEDLQVARIDQQRDEKDLFSGDLHRFIKKEIRQVAIEMGERRSFELPDDFVREIEFYMRRFRDDPHYNKFFTNALRRSRKYIPALRHYFTDRGFPEEIMYLAFIESGFNPLARSRANAVGMFQFINSTGKQYKLTINQHRDERLSPLKSAIACREYMHDLVLELGSFTLALSAYNSGPGRTRQALRQLENFKDRSFWGVREKTTVLKRETREYVPQIFAAIVMGKPGNAARFGFEDVPLPEPGSYRVVVISRPISLSIITSAAGISREELQRLNPDLSPNATKTPARVLDYPLFIPLSSESSVLAAIERNTGTAPAHSRNVSLSGSATAARLDQGMDVVSYKARNRNTVEQIAGWFNTTVSDLQRTNPYLRDRGLREGDVVQISTPDRNWTRVTHTVSRGEAISTIAAKYGVSMKDLRSWNGISGNLIRAGQSLVIYHAGTGRRNTARIHSTANSAHTAKNSSVASAAEVEQTIQVGETFIYAVASGNNLGSIASLFRVYVNDIKRWNNLRSEQLAVGQRLKIYSSHNMRFYKYKVRSGDSYSTISARFEADISTIKFVNGKSGDVLRPGEILSIFSM